MLLDSLSMDAAIVADAFVADRPVADRVGSTVEPIAGIARRPYESDLARTAAVYGLPLQVAEPRVLELRAPNDHQPRLFRSSALAYLGDSGQIRPPADGPFDLIVLHRTLDRAFDGADRQHALRGAAQLVRWAGSLLSPPGVLAGAVSNRYSGFHPGSWRRRTSLERGGRFAASHCLDLLTDASLCRAEVYGVHPSADAPKAILSLDSRSYRQHALRELRRQASAFSGAGYAFRTTWHALGVGRNLHRDLMFWAYRA
jgi:hypothetical protein